MRGVLLLIALLLVAGCTSAQKQGPGPTTSGPATTGWLLDCSLGKNEKGTWPQQCEARGSHTPGSKEETWLAINPKDPKNVVIGAKDGNPESSMKCVWNGLAVTHDGGVTWKDVTIGGKYSSRLPSSPYFGYACNTDPMFQFTSNGDLHYAVEMYNLGGQEANQTVSDPTDKGLIPEGFKVVLAISHDGGDTWPELETTTYHPDMLLVTDYSRMTVSPKSQTILESIGSDDGNRCHVMRSADNGKTATFVEVQTVDGVPCDSGGNGAIAVSPAGVGVLMGVDRRINQVLAIRSTTDGVAWTDSNVAFKFDEITPFPQTESRYRTPDTLELAYDATGGRFTNTLYAVYPAKHTDGADILFRSSRDDGKTWTQPVQVNHAGDVPSNQWMANIAVAGDGSIHVFYMDKKYDNDTHEDRYLESKTCGPHCFIDITHAVSTNGGSVWHEERVSTVSYNGDLGLHQGGFPFIGDYLGVAAVGNDVWAGFPDASLGERPSIAAAHVHYVP